jgi:type I restriction enzyme S subunit
MTDPPPGWTTAPLCDLVVNRDNQRVPVNAKERGERKGVVPYYGAAGQVGWIDRALFDEELLLLGEDGVQFFDSAKPKAYLINGPSWVNNHAHVLSRTNNGPALSYLKHFLDQFDYRGFANGTTRLKLTRSAMDTIPVTLAPLPEQERIVAVIEEAFCKLDAGESGLRTVRQLLARMRDAILASAVTGRLVPQNPDEGAATVASEWTSSKEDPFLGATLPVLPLSWTWARAASVCEAVECGGTPAPAHMTQGQGDVPFIKVYNLTTRGRLDFSVNPTFIDASTHAKQARSAARPGDVLTNIVGPPLGKVSVVPPEFPSWNMNQAVVMFRPSVALRPRFLAIALQSGQVSGRLAATARATAGQFNVSLTACRYLPIPLPPEDEQDRIVQEAERQLSFVDACERTVDVALVRSATLRRSVLKAAFEGRLVPQDPSDEPASVLLESIRAERAVSDGSGGGRRRKKVEAS